jgi:hypothetical protein
MNWWALALLHALIHPTSEKKNSANFACEAFSEVHLYRVLEGFPDKLC